MVLKIMRDAGVETAKHLCQGIKVQDGDSGSSDSIRGLVFSPQPPGHLFPYCSSSISQEIPLIYNGSRSFPASDSSFRSFLGFEGILQGVGSYHCLPSSAGDNSFSISC